MFHIKGKCKVINANCFDVLKRMSDSCMDVTFTSPPYNRKRNDTYKYYDDTLEQYYEMLVSVTDELVRVTKEYVILNLQPNYYCKTDVYKYIGHYCDKIQQVIVWNKSNPTPASGKSITNAYELFIVISDNPVKTNGGYIKNSITTSGNTKKFKGHGAVMKKEVCDWFIENFTLEEQTVLDPFAGMCTTVVSCIEHNRKCYAIELVEEYYKASVKRIKEIVAR